MSDDWQVVADALDRYERDQPPRSLIGKPDNTLAALARLREREAQKDALIVEQEAEYRKERRAAEARVARLELGAGLMDDRVARLEEALKFIEEMTLGRSGVAGIADIARRALAHEEEK